jgi:hypothetical protein
LEPDVPEAPVDVPEAPVDVPEAPVDVPEAPVDVPEAPVDVPEAPVDVPVAPADVPEGPVDDLGPEVVVAEGADEAACELVTSLEFPLDDEPSGEEGVCSPPQADAAMSVTKGSTTERAWVLVLRVTKFMASSALSCTTDVAAAVRYGHTKWQV